MDHRDMPVNMIQKSAAAKIMRCNETTGRYGLTLSSESVKALLKIRAEVLVRTGRVEFEGGVIEKIIFEFCDSPYITQDNYSDIMEELIDIFYTFKSETLDAVDDDESIVFMKKDFDTSCEGSIDLLREDMDTVARHIRGGGRFDDLDSILEEMYDK